MKKDFRTRIAEIAAKIAEVDGPDKVTADADKVNDIIDSITRLESPLGMINSAVEAKDVILHIMGMMTNLRDGGKRTALNQALTAMAKGAADKTMSDMGEKDASINEGFARMQKLAGLLKEDANIQELSPELRNKAAAISADKFYTTEDPLQRQKSYSQTKALSDIPAPLKKEAESIADQIAKENHTVLSNFLFKKDIETLDYKPRIYFELLFKDHNSTKSREYNVIISKDDYKFDEKTDKTLRLSDPLNRKMITFLKKLQKEVV